MYSCFDVIFEDNHLLVVNKRAGVLVQGDETGDTPLIEHCKHYIKEKYHKPGEVFLGLVHRIDRPVSGLVTLARTSKALSRMNELFRDRATKKVYWAIVGKIPSKNSGTLVHWLRKDERKNRTTAFHNETEGALKSELAYRTLSHKSGRTLLEVSPVTGRPHQIRVQLSTMGCPIVGDVKYGYPEANADGSICLHSRRLSFVHPVKKQLVRFVAPLPDADAWSPFSTYHEPDELD